MGSGSDYFIMPTVGSSAIQRWSEPSATAPLCPGVLVAAGAFDAAVHMLHLQAGIVNVAPLRERFAETYAAAYASLPTLPNLPSTVTPLHAVRMFVFIKNYFVFSRVIHYVWIACLRFRGFGFLHLPIQSRQPDRPMLAYGLHHCVDKLKAAYKSVTEGKFQPALEQFVDILHTVPLIGLENKAQAKEVQDLISIAREYITAMRLELRRRDEADPVRQVFSFPQFGCCFLPNKLCSQLTAISKCYHI